MPVAATFDGDVKVGDIRITAQDNDPKIGDIHSSVRLSDGDNEASVNPDGSLNVKIVTGGTSSSAKNIYTEALSVPAASLTALGSYVVPSGQTAILEKISVSGENIAKYVVLLNGDPIETLRTYFGASLNALLDFTSASGKGYLLEAGDQLDVQVIHNRPDIGDFNSRIQVVEM